MKFGCDFLGGARYQSTVLAEQPRSFGFGVFADVQGFGKAYRLIEQVAKLGVPFIRVQVMWKDDHNFRSSDVPEVEKRCKLLAPLVSRYKLKWYVSPCCENNLNAAQFEPFAAAVRRQLPSVEIVNSPNAGKGHVSSKYINEYHHEKPRGGRFAFSYDGANCVDSNIEEDKKRYANAEYFMLWNSQCNGNRKVFKPEDKRGPKDHKDRSKRIYWPTPKQIDSWVWLATHSKGATSCPKGGIFKSHGDQHDVPPAGKDQKPVWVGYPKWRAIEVKAQNGQIIDRAPYFGTFTGGGHRYYHNDWGFTLAEKAHRIQGHGVCNVFADGKRIGTINLAFRDGGYR